ncbi:hypothetical protein BH10ACT9_BH10ACT9_39620 [soil metagenome]
MAHFTKLVCAGFAVSAVLTGGSTAVANASEIKADPSIVSASSGAGTQVRTSAIQGDVRISGTQGDMRGTIMAVPGTKAHGMPTPNSCEADLSYTCDD